MGVPITVKKKNAQTESRDARRPKEAPVFLLGDRRPAYSVCAFLPRLWENHAALGVPLKSTGNQKLAAIANGGRIAAIPPTI